MLGLLDYGTVIRHGDLPRSRGAKPEARITTYLFSLRVLRGWSGGVGDGLGARVEPYAANGGAAGEAFERGRRRLVGVESFRRRSPPAGAAGHRTGGDRADARQSARHDLRVGATEFPSVQRYASVSDDLPGETGRNKHVSRFE